MKWVVGAVALVLIVAAASAAALRTLNRDEPVYSVSQLDAALRRHPSTVVGHVIRVRGVVGFCPVRAGCPPNMPPILSAHLGTPSADPPLELQYDTRGSLLASLRGIPLISVLVPHPSHLIDGYQGVVRLRIEPVPAYACYERLCYAGLLQDMAQP